MSKAKSLLNKTLATFFSRKNHSVPFKSLCFRSNYEARNVSGKQFDDAFDRMRKQQLSKNRQSFLGQQPVDDLTKDSFQQYELSLRLLREQHDQNQKRIKAKYEVLMKEEANKISNNQRQLQQDQQSPLQILSAQRLEQLLINQQSLKNKTQGLLSQFKPKFIQKRNQYELQYIKKYMLENIGSLKNEQASSQPEMDIISQLLNPKPKQQQSYIPNGLVLKKLSFKTVQGKQKQLLLAGVQENDQSHCTYLKTLIDKLKIKHVLTMLPPDMPFFIKTQSSFLTEWSQFLRSPSPSTKFFLNPNPSTLNDITLDKLNIPYVLSSMQKSKSFYTTAYSLMQLNESNFSYEHQPIYSGLMSSSVEKVYFCDFPWMKEREMIALNCKLEDMRQLAKQTAYFRQQKRQNFDPELLLPKQIVQKKFAHIIKLARTISLTQASPCLLLCPSSIAQVISQQWQQSPGSQFLQYNPSLNSYFLDLPLSKMPQNSVLFMEFIEKLVILDVVLKPYIEKFFVKYESFPYSCRNTVGGKENLTKVFILWRHYYDLYSGGMKGKFDRMKERGQTWG